MDDKLLQLIEATEPFLTPDRKETIERILSNRLSMLTVGVENPSDIHNAMAIVRSCDAFGVQHFHLIDPSYKKGVGRQTAQGTLSWVDLHKHKTTESFFDQMRDSDICVAGAALGGGVKMEKLPLDRPLCLLFGNEHQGLSDQALSKCDLTFEIEMFGAVESLNLSVAAGVSLFHTSKRLREKEIGERSLDEKERLRLTAHHYQRTLGPEKAEKIAKRKSLCK